MSFCDDLKLQVYLPVADAFVLDQSKLNSEDLLGPVSGGSYEWRELIGETSHVDITRGADQFQSIFARCEVGECNFTYHADDFNPFYRNTIDPNAPVRLQVNDGVEDITLFSGFVESVDAQFVKEGRTAINVKCVDAIASMNRRLSIPRPVEAFRDRFAALVAESGYEYHDIFDGGFPIDDIGDSTECAATGGGLKLWDDFVRSTNTAGGFCYVTREGKIAWFHLPNGWEYFRTLIQFSDNHDDAQITDKHHCFSELEYRYDTRAVVNDLEVENHKFNGTEDVSIRYKYEDSNSVQAYGRIDKKVDANFESVSEMNDMVQKIFDTFGAPKKRVESVTYQIEDDYEYAPIDFDSEVTVQLSNNILDETKYQIYGIEHSIEPDRWEVTLKLYETQLKEDDDLLPFP